MRGLARAAVAVVLAVSVLLSACNSNEGTGGRISSKPLVRDLTTDLHAAWLNAPVKFSVTCLPVTPHPELHYLWDFGDGSSEETTSPQDVHNYKTAQIFTYTVKCRDGSGDWNTDSDNVTEEAKTLRVWGYDFAELASSVCATGAQGFGWCWQNPLPTGSKLRAVSAVSPFVAWIVGDGRTILQTNDGGQHWMTRFPDGQNSSSSFISVKATDRNNAIVLASDGHVLTTTDGGEKWKTRIPTSGSPLTLTAATALASGNFWAINKGTAVVHSNDGGATWPTAALPVSNLPANLASIAAADEKTAWVVGDATLLYTNDGSSWNPPASAELLGLIKYSSLKFGSVSVTRATTMDSPCGATARSSVWLSGSTDLAGGTPITIRSTDNFATYQALGSSGTGIAGYLAQAFDESTAWIASPLLVPAQPGAIDTRYIPKATIGINSTNPQGSIPFSNAQPTINAIDSRDCRFGWAAGNGGTVLATSDAAHTWNVQSSTSLKLEGTPVFTSVIAASKAIARTLDSQVAIVSGATGGSPAVSSAVRVLGTEDGGREWSAESAFPPTLVLGTFIPPDPKIATNTAGFQVAVGPNIVATRLPLDIAWLSNERDTNEARCVFPRDETSSSTCTNFGLTGPTGIFGYSPGNIVTGGVGLWKSVSVNATSAWAMDGLGNVIRELTSLPGHWNLVSAANATGTSPLGRKGSALASLNAIASLDPSIAVVVGDGIWRTTDSGASWPAATAKTGCVVDLSGVHLKAVVLAPGKSAGWAVGPGIILRTEDGGKSWCSQSTPSLSLSNLDLMEITSPDGVSAWVVGRDLICASGCALVLHTNDGGATWRMQETGADSLSAISAADTNNAWVVGSDGAIMKTATAGEGPPVEP